MKPELSLAALQGERFERETLRERDPTGLAHARHNGKKLGRPQTAALQTDRARTRYRAGVRKTEIARRVRIGRTSIRRILAFQAKCTVGPATR